ncbi:hypothetical protein BKA69DRAFT_701786 [Paraphysoderma sedebokerense]|nr:hypothetical protein BKA69DRAFT_701786 [Paraphysoderma sedebokerense]
MSLLVLSKAKMSGASFGIINLTINFMQTILIIRNFQLEWPEQLMAVVDMVAIVNFNIEYAGPECFSDLYVFDYPLKMKISLLIPFALIGVVGLCAATWAGISKLNRLIRKTKVQESNNYQLISGVKFYNVLLSVTFITVAQNSLALFDCTYEADGNYYLDADPSLICFQDWWYRDLGIAIAAVLLYVFGIPVYFFMIYYTSQQAKYTGPTWTSLKNFSTKILHADRLFHPQHQYFVFIQFMQKIVFVLINMFFTRYVAVQSTLMLYVLLVLFYVYHTKKPYLHPILNILESLSLALSLVVLTLGLLFRTDTLRTTEQRLMVTLFILVLVFGFVFMAVCAAIYDFQVRVKDYVRNRTGSNLSMFRRSISSAKRIID